MSLFQKLEKGLKEAQEFESENKKKALRVRRHNLEVEPLPIITADQIRMLRVTFGLTQRNFATLVGVSFETVAKWEQGESFPKGSTLRLLQIFKKRPQIVDEVGLIQRA